MPKPCIVLLHIWPLADHEFCPVVSEAVGQVRENIVRLVRLANEHEVPIILDNDGQPLPNHPALCEALQASTVRIDERAFVGVDGARPLEIEPKRWHLYNSFIHNTVSARDHDEFFYAGMWADFSVAFAKRLGYAVMKKEVKYLISDATIIAPTQSWNQDSHDYLQEAWGAWYNVRRARPIGQPMPWRTAQGIMNDTEFFCHEYATKFCVPITVDEVTQLLCSTTSE